jgi:hypothetical protein
MEDFGMGANQIVENLHSVIRSKSKFTGVSHEATQMFRRRVEGGFNILAEPP